MFTGDYHGNVKVKKLSYAEHGIYRMLLDFQSMEDNFKLPKDVETIKRMASPANAEESRCLEKVLGIFFLQDDYGFYYNKKMLEVCTVAASRRESSVENGKKGGRPKKPRNNPEDNPEDNPQDNPQDNLEYNLEYNLEDNHLKSHILNLKDLNLKTKKEEKHYVGTESGFRLATMLFESILTHLPKAKPPNMKKWASDIDLLIRVDGRSETEIADMIAWVSGSDFWKAVILSAGNLRDKWDKLVAQKQRNQNKGENSGNKKTGTYTGINDQDYAGDAERFFAKARLGVIPEK